MIQDTRYIDAYGSEIYNHQKLNLWEAHQKEGFFAPQTAGQMLYGLEVYCFIKNTG